MKKLQEEFNALSGKIIRMDELNALAKQVADKRYKGIKGKFKWITEGVANIPAIPGLVSKFAIAIKKGSAFPPIPSESYKDATCLFPSDSESYVSAISFLESIKEITGEKVLARSVILEAVKQCPDHRQKLASGLLRRV